MKIKHCFLLLILVFAFILRYFQLVDIPSGFNQDEAAFGYNAYSILKTGKDEFGKSFPLILKSFGDQKLAFFSYILIPFVKIFGLNEFSVRFSVVVIGCFSILINYFIVEKLTSNIKLSLLSIFLLSLFPWHVLFSRYASESILALFFVYSSILVFLLWREKRKFLLLFASYLFLLLSIISYYSSWYVAILLAFIYFFIVLIYQKKRINFRKTIVCLLLSISPILLIGFITISSGGQRLKQINIIDHQNALGLLKEQIREDSHSPIVLTRLFHNKLIFYPRFVIENLSKTVNFATFFIKGETTEKRFSIPYSGLLYLSLSPFIFFGLIFLIKRYSIRNVILMTLFTTFSFLGGAFSVYGSQGQRTLLASPVLSFITAYGIFHIFHIFTNRRLFSIVLFLFLTLFVYELMVFNHQFFWHYKVHQPWFNNYGEKEMVKSVNELALKYDKVVIAGDPSIFFYFYNQLNPQTIQEKFNDTSTDQLGYLKRKKIGDYLLMDVDCPAAGKLNVLYVCKGSRIPKNSKLLSVISFMDNQPAYIFIEFLKKENQEKLPSTIEYMK